MADTAVKKLLAVVTNNRGVECVEIRINVNSAPSATLQLGAKSDTEQVVPALTSDVLAEIKKAQDKRLAGVVDPDITLLVDDAVYGQLVMKGYEAAPMWEISEASIGCQMSILDKVSILDALDLSIYLADVPSQRKNERSDTMPKPKGGNVTQLLSELTDWLVGLYGISLSEETDPVKQEIMKMRHELNNSGPLKIWKKILQDSEVRYESWGKMQELSAHAATTLSQKTVTMLSSPSSGFWNVMNRLMAAFQMYYVPAPNIGGPGGESYGKFMCNKFKMDKIEGNLELDIINLNVRDGSARILQVGGVIMELGAAAGQRANERKPVTPAVAGVWPSPIKKGYIHNEAAPIWLVDAVGAHVLGSKIDEKKDVEPGTEEPNYDIGSYTARREGGKAHLEKFSTARSDVMTELCESMFKELQLADSMVSVKIPINTTVQVGKRQTIKMGDAGDIEGFVSAVVHKIDLRQGKELDSFSQVTITHVKY